MPFVNLPAEVKQGVLSHLPSKEIRSSRQVCRHFKKLVDDAPSVLANAEIQEELARLQAEQTYLFEPIYYPDGERTILDVLKGFVLRCGIPRTHQNRLEMAAGVLAVYYREGCKEAELPSLALTSPVGFAAAFAFAGFFLANVMELHLRKYTELPMEDDPDHASVHSFVARFFARDVRDILDITRDDVGTSYFKVVKGLFKGARILAINEHLSPAIPQLHPRYSAPRFGFSSETAVQGLGLPAPPEHRIFSYAVRSTEARNLIEQLSNGGKLTLPQKAIVLKALYLG